MQGTVFRVDMVRRFSPRGPLFLFTRYRPSFADALRRAVWWMREDPSIERCAITSVQTGKVRFVLTHQLVSPRVTEPDWTVGLLATVGEIYRYEAAVDELRAEFALTRPPRSPSPSGQSLPRSRRSRHTPA